ncbi:MAG: transporter [Sphingomicrobium sp.]
MLGALLLALAAQSAAAPADDLCTDRPGLETGTCIVPAGVIQVETSLVDWTNDRSDGVRTRQWSVGTTAVRFGLGSASEVQLGWTPWVRETARGAGAHNSAGGFGDALLVYKTRFTRADAPLAVALMPFVKLPLAPRPLGNRRVEGGVVAPIDVALAENSTLTLSPEANWNSDEDRNGHHLGLAGAVALGLELSDRLSAGLTVWGQRNRDPAGTVDQAVAGLSLAWLVRPKLQFDVEADAGISGAAPDLELIVGISIRR